MFLMKWALNSKERETMRPRFEQEEEEEEAVSVLLFLQGGTDRE